MQVPKAVVSTIDRLQEQWEECSVNGWHSIVAFVQGTSTVKLGDLWYGLDSRLNRSDCVKPFELILTFCSFWVDLIRLRWFLERFDLLVSRSHAGLLHGSFVDSNSRTPIAGFCMVWDLWLHIVLARPVTSIRGENCPMTTMRLADIRPVAGQQVLSSHAYSASRRVSLRPTSRPINRACRSWNIRYYSLLLHHTSSIATQSVCLQVSQRIFQSGRDAAPACHEEPYNHEMRKSE
jgi:hypothetical protein